MIKFVETNLRGKFGSPRAQAGRRNTPWKILEKMNEKRGPKPSYSHRLNFFDFLYSPRFCQSIFEWSGQFIPPNPDAVGMTLGTFNRSFYRNNAVTDFLMAQMFQQVVMAAYLAFHIYTPFLGREGLFSPPAVLTGFWLHWRRISHRTSWLSLSRCGSLAVWGSSC